MNRRGYNAFLMGTATDLPCRGYSLRVQRREGVEAAAELTGVLKGRRRKSGVVSGFYGTEGN